MSEDIRDLRERLLNAAEMLHAMMVEAYQKGNAEEAQRLRGKREGALLAFDYTLAYDDSV